MPLVSLGQENEMDIGLKCNIKGNGCRNLFS
jgi:hypothetical protein